MDINQIDDVLPEFVMPGHSLGSALAGLAGKISAPPTPLMNAKAQASINEFRLQH